MKILCLGDVVGSVGCEAVRRVLPGIKQQYNIALTVANGENSAEGNGILPQSAEHLFASGVDVITGGNHTFRRREIYDSLESSPFLLRPANYPAAALGKGVCTVDMGRVRVGVVNLMGNVYMEPTDSPFDAADRAIAALKSDGIRIILVDFHAEATGEKGALGYYLDGRVSALFGTHTHIQTNDERILPQGTGFISDLGMCGPLESVLGVKPELAVQKMRVKMPVRFENAAGDAVVCGCIFDVDERSGRTLAAEKIRISVKSD
ncbi:MAG: TIGR00282 family metallophosphoesterase [Acutalibacteraceae bacterium]